MSHTIICKNCNTEVAKTPNKICVKCNAPNWVSVKSNQATQRSITVSSKLVCKNCNVLVARTPNQSCINCNKRDWGYSQADLTSNNVQLLVRNQTVKTKNKDDSSFNINKILMLALLVIFCTMGFFLFTYDGEPPAFQTATNLDEIKKSIAYIKTSKGTGTGFLISPDIILTAGHVADGESSFEITFTEYSADIYRAEVLHNALIPARNNFDYFLRDYAFLRLNKEVDDLKPLKLGNSDSVNELDDIYTIGHSRGDISLSHTKGSINSKKYGTEQFDLFKHSVDSNPGNSGGPLISKSTNEVIGVLVGGRGVTVSSSGIDIPQGENIGVKINAIRSDFETLINLN